MKYNIFNCKYLFHIHTVHTDGFLSVRDYFDFAGSVGIERVIFLEHIRRRPTYDTAEFARQVRECSAASGIPACVGFEAKLLADGRLDIAPEAIELADVIGIAEHGFPPDFTLLRDAFSRAVEDCRDLVYCKEIVWAHPGLWLKKDNLINIYINNYIYYKYIS
jgi:histidinol phosphatase-like PHP family hydrolase